VPALILPKRQTNASCSTAMWHLSLQVSHPCTFSRGMIRGCQACHRFLMSSSLRFPCVQFREVFLTRRYLGISMEYAAGGDMFDFFVRNKAFVNVKVPPAWPALYSRLALYTLLALVLLWPSRFQSSQPSQLQH
jgi:hypothetical protein